MAKEIVAKDNEISRAPERKIRVKAYFNCHTDITIPYDELGSPSRLCRLQMEKNSRYHQKAEDSSLPGTEELNEPLDEDKCMTTVVSSSNK